MTALPLQLGRAALALPVSQRDPRGDLKGEELLALLEGVGRAETGFSLSSATTNFPEPYLAFRRAMDALSRRLLPGEGDVGARRVRQGKERFVLLHGIFLSQRRKR